MTKTTPSALTPEALDTIEAQAKKALEVNGPGVWWDADELTTILDFSSTYEAQVDANHIITASPEAVLALVSELRRLRTENEGMNKQIQDYATRGPYENGFLAGVDSDLHLVKKARAERDALQAKLDAKTEECKHPKDALVMRGWRQVCTLCGLGREI